MDYGGKYLKIRKAIYEAGFDEFYQSGSTNRFHKINIVAESAILGLRFWFHIDGGYEMADEIFITTRKIGADEPDERIYCKNQQEMVDHINTIRQNIEKAKEEQRVKQIYTHDEAMLIVAMFEEVLCAHNIKVPSPEDHEREPDDEVGLYGSTYSDLLDSVEAALVEMLAKHTAGTEVVEGVFSGTV